MTQLTRALTHSRAPLLHAVRTLSLRFCGHLVVMVVHKYTVMRYNLNQHRQCVASGVTSDGYATQIKSASAYDRVFFYFPSQCLAFHL